MRRKTPKSRRRILGERAHAVLSDSRRYLRAPEGVGPFSEAYFGHRRDPAEGDPGPWFGYAYVDDPPRGQEPEYVVRVYNDGRVLWRGVDITHQHWVQKALARCPFPDDSEA